jgi:hypothetical protein
LDCPKKSSGVRRPKKRPILEQLTQTIVPKPSGRRFLKHAAARQEPVEWDGPSLTGQNPVGNAPSTEPLMTHPGSAYLMHRSCRPERARTSAKRRRLRPPTLRSDVRLRPTSVRPTRAPISKGGSQKPLYCVVNQTTRAIR